MSRPLADLLALFAFAATGIYAHHQALVLGEVFRAAWPFLLAWFLVAPFTGTWRDPRLAPLVATWAIAVPSGWLVRLIAYAEPLDGARFLFLATSLGFSLPFLLLFRLISGGMRRKEAA